MDNRISFAEFIKNEILKFNWEEAQLDILFYSFIKTNGVSKGKKFVVGSSLKKQGDLISKLFKKFYNVEPDLKESTTKINFIINDEGFENKFKDKWDSFKPKTVEEHKALIAGCFVGKGWISKPSSKYYHMEFRVGPKEHVKLLERSINNFEIQSKTILKNGWYVVYIKKSMALSDLLNLMEASRSMMYFEDERINRNLIASYSKMESIEPYNKAKTKAISDLQIAAIKKIKGTPTWRTLNKNIIEIAELRIEFPEYSLSDIQYIYNRDKEKEISKSTVNNWLKQIVDLAE